jgi:hypothetical protein
MGWMQMKGFLMLLCTGMSLDYFIKSLKGGIDDK